MREAQSQVRCITTLTVRTSRKILASCLVVCGLTLLMAVGASLPSYRAACGAADRCVADATDGPWQRSAVGLVGDFNFEAGRVPIVPHWVFRNPQIGAESKRIYVTFSGERALSYAFVLDPVPLIGLRP